MYKESKTLNTLDASKFTPWNWHRASILWNMICLKDYMEGCITNFNQGTGIQRYSNSRLLQCLKQNFDNGHLHKKCAKDGDSVTLNGI